MAHKKSIAVAASGLCILALTATGCSSSSSTSSGGGSGLPTVRMALLPGIVTNVPARLAADQGLYQKQGISVDISVAPTTVTADTLLGTTADVIAAAPSTIILANQAGKDLAFICGGFSVSPVYLVAPADSSLQAVSASNTWQQVLTSLKGKTIGLPVPLGSGPAKLFAGTMQSLGISPSDYTVVNIGVGPAAQAAVANDKVDAAIMPTPDPERLVSSGKGKELLYMPDGPEQYQTFGSGWVTTAAWAKANAATSAKLCQALSDSYAYMNDPANQEVVNKAIVASIGDMAQDGVDNVRKTLAVWKALIPKNEFDSTIKTYVALGVVPGTPAESYDNMVIQPTPPTAGQ